MKLVDRGAKKYRNAKLKSRDLWQGSGGKQEGKEGSGINDEEKGSEPVNRAIPAVGVTARRPLRGPTLKLIVVSAHPHVRTSQRDGSVPIVA
jgi:hypothetical protein